MPATVLTQTGSGSSRIVAVDYFQNPVNVGIQAVVTGSATYTVEYTLDDITAAGFTAVAARWTAATGSLSGATTSVNGLIDVPCRGVRLRISSGAGTVVATICQAGVG
jgi:hypothetical protein